MKKTHHSESALIKQAIIYARVSSKEQEREGFSIPSQLKLLQDYAAQNGIKITNEFIDVETAKRTGRTHFNEMVSLLKKNRAKIPAGNCAILVEKTDRLYRNIKDWVTIDELGAEIHFVKENVVLSAESRSSEKFMHGIKVLMAKNYIDNLSEETSKGMLEKARQGLYPSNAPFGYINFTDNLRKIIVPHPVNSPLITQIFAWYASGQYSLSGIFERLSNEFASVFENRKKLTKSCIHQILTNPIYYGDFVWKHEYYRGTHEPLVSRELFDAVQEMLHKNGQQRMPQNRHKFQFQGLVKCGYCGCAMVAERKKGKYTYYHCTQNKGKCPGSTSIPEAELERQFEESLQLIQIPEEAVTYVIKALKDSHHDKKAYRDKVVAELREEALKIESRIDAMYLDKLDGKIPSEYYGRKQSEWRREVEKIESTIIKHINANDCYLDKGIQLLELLQRTVITYKKHDFVGKKEFLKIVHSNSIWKDGKLHHDYRQPFDFITETNIEYKKKMAVSREKNDHRPIWLPFADSNHGQGD
jgi:site-specific DNA recombinase